MKILWLRPLKPDLQKRIEIMLEPLGGQLVAAPEEFTVHEARHAANSFILENIRDAEILVPNWWSITQEQFEAAKSLKWVSLPFAGVNTILKNRLLAESDIILTNGAGIMAPGLADQTLGYILSFSRLLPQQFKAQQEKRWGVEPFPAIELVDRTLGIIGYGSIGREIAKRARGFGLRIIATRTNLQKPAPEVDVLLPPTELNRLLTESDYVVVAAPLTPETVGMLGHEQFRQMKPTAILINIARGPLVREAELIEALQAKIIAGAALDVFEHEPLSTDSPLWEMENVIVTGHTSGFFDGFQSRAVELFCQNLQRYLNQEPLVNIVDKKKGY